MLKVILNYKTISKIVISENNILKPQNQTLT